MSEASPSFRIDNCERLNNSRTVCLYARLVSWNFSLGGARAALSGMLDDNANSVPLITFPVYENRTT